MSLRDSLKVVSGNKRRYLLLRIADIDPGAAMKLVGITRGSYNTWLANPEFIGLHRQIEEFNKEYKQEAIQLLRRDNQLEAVLLEAKIVSKMKEEIEAGEYDLIRTNLAREVYSSLMSQLDVTPKIANLTWEQKILNLTSPVIPQITEGDTIDAEFSEKETVQQEQPQKSQSQ